MKSWLEVIEVCRDRNSAYVAHVTIDPYWATNLEVKLNWLEQLTSREFKDGTYHPFITVDVTGLEIQYL